MTNDEALKQLDRYERGMLLCRLYRENEDEYEDRCSRCPVTRLCGYEHNGFVEWLKRENKEDLEGWLF